MQVYASFLSFYQKYPLQWNIHYSEITFGRFMSLWNHDLHLKSTKSYQVQEINSNWVCKVCVEWYRKIFFLWFCSPPRCIVYRPKSPLVFFEPYIILLVRVTLADRHWFLSSTLRSDLNPPFCPTVCRILVLLNRAWAFQNFGQFGLIMKIWNGLTEFHEP